MIPFKNKENAAGFQTFRKHPALEGLRNKTTKNRSKFRGALL